MNIAVLSDIHGNITAFKQVLDYLKNREIDAFCILGDYSGEFAGVRETLDMIYALQDRYPVHIIKGNKEEYLMLGLGGNHPEWDEYPSTVGMLRYAYDNMRKRDWEFIKNLPEILTVEYEGMESLFLCHGSPKEVKGKLLQGSKKNKEYLEGVKEKYVLCGHTHRYVEFEDCGKKIINPGAVGNPLDDGRHDHTSFVILSSVGREWEAEHIYLKQNVDAMVKNMMSHNLHRIAPYWTACNEAFFRGSLFSNGEILDRAMQITEEETGSCEWPAIPEKAWEKAFREMIVGQFPLVYDKMMVKLV